MLTKKEVEEISKKYYKKVYSYCLSNSSFNEYDASDITQEVFLFLQERSDSLVDINIESWLYNVAEYKIKSFYKKMNREQSYLALSEDFSYADLIAVFDEYFPVTDDDIVNYIKMIVKTLNEKEKIIFNKVYVEKLDYESIAKELNISRNAVALRAFRLRQKIKAEITILLSVIGQIIIRMFF